MKKLFSLGLVAMLALTAVVSSCGKYEEGSKFTLLSAKARMVNSWDLVKYEVNNAAQDMGGSTLTWNLEKDGKATATWSSGGFSFSDIGTWELNSDKTDLILKDSNGDVETYEIVQLKNKDLKIRQVSTNYTDVWTFEGN